MKKSKDSKKAAGMPDGVPPPPDIIDTSKAGPTYSDLEKGKKKRQKKGRNHPTDAYEPMGKKKGCGGCCGCFGGAAALLILALLAATIWTGYYGPGRYFIDGEFEKVALKDDETTISEAPDEPTFYIGNTVVYEAPETTVPIAIVGSDVTVSGDFLDNLTVTGAKVTAAEGTRVAGDLEVWAGEFHDKGVTLNGELKGRVGQSLD